MIKRKASAKWEGSLKDGKGSMEYGSYTGNFSFTSRFEDGEGTNPEELIGAAHAGCFSMAFSAELGRAGYSPEYVNTEATVQFDKDDDGWVIKGIVLKNNSKVPGIEEDEFQEIANGAKEGCPISRSLAVDISLEATLD